LLQLMISGTFIVLCYFRRMNFVLFLNDFCNVYVMNLSLLSREISWNLWGLKILVDLFWFLSWNILCVLFYNDLALMVRHTWLVDSLIRIFSLNIFILLIHSVHRCVIITFDCYHLLLLDLFLLIDKLYLFLTVS
jgi:hypothetical protein